MIKVIFSTFNGENTLHQTLQAFLKIKTPPEGYTLIIIDNGSHDNSFNIISEYSEKLPIQLITESKRGKNFALNSAIKHVNEDDFLVFTDDDVVPSENWLISLSECAHDHPDFSIFGGPITPIWPIEPPDWLKHTLDPGMLYAITPEIPSQAVPAHYIWGANMAIRAKVFSHVGLFNVKVGPDGSESYAMGSETDFLHRAERLGYKAWFNSDASIGHQIRLHQMERKWALQRYYRQGRGGYANNPPSSHKKRTLFGRDIWAIKAYSNSILKLGMYRLLGNKLKIITEGERSKFIKGQLDQSLLMNRSRP